MMPETDCRKTCNKVWAHIKTRILKARVFIATQSSYSSLVFKTIALKFSCWWKCIKKKKISVKFTHHLNIVQVLLKGKIKKKTSRRKTQIITLRLCLLCIDSSHSASLLPNLPTKFNWYEDLPVRKMTSLNRVQFFNW